MWPCVVYWEIGSQAASEISFSSRAISVECGRCEEHEQETLSAGGEQGAGP